MNINIRQIQHFIAVAEELHFRRAAELANVAQPALSRSVQTLENELGVQLLKRNNRNVSLTTAGKEFLNGCKKVVETLQDSVDNAKRADEYGLNGLRVGYTYNALYGNMPTLIDAFEKLNPSLKIELITDTDAKLSEQLRRGHLDCCFHIGTESDHSDSNLSSAIVQHDSFSVVVYRTHAFANKSIVAANELNGETIFLADGLNGTQFKNHVQRILNEGNVEANIKLVDQNIIGILGLVTLGKGITFAPENCTCPEILHKLKLVGTDSKLPSLMTWRNDETSEPARAFRNFVLNSLQSTGSTNSAIHAETPASTSPALSTT